MLYCLMYVNITLLRYIHPLGLSKADPKLLPWSRSWTGGRSGWRSCLLAAHMTSTMQLLLLQSLTSQCQSSRSETWCAANR